MSNQNKQKFSLTELYDFENKHRVVEDIVNVWLNRLASMFEYKDLPEKINPKIMDRWMFLNGSVGLFNHKGRGYARFGSYAGQLDQNNVWTQYNIQVPYLNIAHSYDVGKDVVVMRNDTGLIGLLPILLKYATQQAENELSLNIATINSRMQTFITAPNEKSRANAQQYLDGLSRGKLSVVHDNAFGDSAITCSVISGADRMLQALTERQQFIEGKIWNELGLNANWNAKKEGLASAEVGVNDDCLLPLIEDMLYNRKKALEDAKDILGGEWKNASVDFASAWKQKELKDSLQQDMFIERKGLISRMMRGKEPQFKEGGNDEFNSKQDAPNERRGENETNLGNQRKVDAERKYNK